MKLEEITYYEFCILFIFIWFIFVSFIDAVMNKVAAMPQRYSKNPILDLIKTNDIRLYVELQKERIPLLADIRELSVQETSSSEALGELILRIRAWPLYQADKYGHLVDALWVFHELNDQHRHGNAIFGPRDPKSKLFKADKIYRRVELLNELYHRMADEMM